MGREPTVAALARSLLGDDLPVAVEAFDGSRHGPASAATKLVVRTPDALRHVVAAPGELGLSRAYVAGDLDIEGDVFAALTLRDRLPNPRLTPAQWALAARLVAKVGMRRPPVPPEEAQVRGRLHSLRRDAVAVTHHYDVSNAFYRLVLGPSMTYSCAVFPEATTTLEQAQEAKVDLVCRKLGLRPGVRLLDVGCGWGTLLLHAARAYGVTAVGVTLSGEQADLARRRIAAAGLEDRIDVRVQDYREVADGPFDAISSIGMFEHVGRDRAATYFGHLHELLAPGGRLLNHAITRPPSRRTRLPSRSFVGRYVFPDGELLEVGDTVSLLQAAGFEARHVESLREHYARTLRAWVANLERHWDEAVAEVGAGRARVWRLYMAGAALGFEAGRTSVHQVLAVRPTPAGASGMPARPEWEVRVVEATSNGAREGARGPVRR